MQDLLHEHREGEDQRRPDEGVEVGEGQELRPAVVRDDEQRQAVEHRQEDAHAGGVDPMRGQHREEGGHRRDAEGPAHLQGPEVREGLSWPPSAGRPNLRPPAPRATGPNDAVPNTSSRQTARMRMARTPKNQKTI